MVQAITSPFLSLDASQSKPPPPASYSAQIGRKLVRQSCPLVLSSSCFLVLLSSCPFVNRPLVLLSFRQSFSCPLVLLFSCPLVLLSFCPFAILPFCPFALFVLLSFCPFIFVVFLSFWPFFHYVFLSRILIQLILTGHWWNFLLRILRSNNNQRCNPNSDTEQRLIILRRFQYFWHKSLDNAK